MTEIPPPPPPIAPRPRRGRPVSHRRRPALLRRVLAGRRRRVEVTEPISRVRRLLEHWAVPLVAVGVAASVVLAILVYLYFNHRLSSLERDRAKRISATNQVLAEVKSELQQARASNDELRSALCSVIDTVPPGRGKLIDLTRQELHCGPYTPRPSSSPSPTVRGSASPSNSPPASSAPARPSGTGRPPSPSSSASPPTPTASATPSASATCVIVLGRPICLH